MNNTDVKAKVEAAMALLSESSTSFEKVRSVAGLLKGVNKKLDRLALMCEKHVSVIELATAGGYIELAADALPEETEAQKKRKKALLLFIKSWGELKAEVVRVQSELDQGHSVSDSSFWKNMLSAAKGPLAVITIIAIGVGVMSQTSVDVVIENDGCGTLYASGTTISIPGLVLPGDPITAGNSATATLPPLSITIDGTAAGTLMLSAIAFDFSIKLGTSVRSVTFDDQPLLGERTTIDLGSRDTHTLKLTCQ